MAFKKSGVIILLFTAAIVQSYISKISTIAKIRHYQLLFNENEKSSKGFAAPKPKVVVETDKDAGTLTYENQAKRGVPEYNIFLRPTNGTNEEWVPVGSMTIPRDVKPSKAIFDVEEELLKGTFKLYPKLKAFYEFRSDKVNVFEYGYCLKAFPDESITIAERATTNNQGNFLTNWFGKLTNPIDNSELKNKGDIYLKQ